MTDPTAPVTPRTEAGQRLLDNLLIGSPIKPSDQEFLERAILAIEREAGSPDALRVALDRFVEWASDWLDEKRRREQWPAMPGTMPPASFAERPAELNRQLAALMEEGRAALAASDARPAGIDVERLAAVEHEQWVEWASTLLATEPGISDARRERWQRLIATPYADLTEAEKHQDRIYAEKVLRVVLSREPDR
jgi:hypothetical protein